MNVTLQPFDTHIGDMGVMYFEARDPRTGVVVEYHVSFLYEPLLLLAAAVYQSDGEGGEGLGMVGEDDADVEIIVHGCQVGG